ncbi:Ohr family peroxiredoxin [Jonesia denitrificans]|uniref:OsmC family protein n=1 Tax=Jonesia denitrificans (strain ATCC 14870 / DSM 20603 / BCRC 15368 / CIP 55.134 / JCM 11481 / NBRC 15587 / NCTC 10816 / Prevot 55134) TaxID=471856 RepID=C7QZJ9_JONDD|nr:Ohr family peroxiredoxin [Jonesia denitrificans]ACV08005.1 OsmC family protein [Jonesia denitrificans DSM 20603]ASE08303.1 Ohr family peroxiredoxin [Jonesia denitrificans]QXB42906.1 Ohr family peroxiredoxin [Jonesia denitrificans]SQH19982.1 Organic hydroperoxide resistance protein-like [Jonesia denitrificans]
MSDPKYVTSATSWGGGRVGRVATQDQKIDLELSVPAGLGGDDGPGSNPEQLFAAAWASCFHGAVKAIARSRKVDVGESAVTVEVALNGEFDSGFFFTVVIEGEFPGVDDKEAHELLAAAHEKCPYSRVTRGNAEVELRVVS